MTADRAVRCDPPPLAVRTSADGRHVVVLLAGEADLSTAPLLREQVVRALARRPRSLVLDAVGLTFCDLCGLDALTDAVREAEVQGVVVTLRPSTQLSWLMAAAARACVPGLRADGSAAQRLDRVAAS